MFHLLLVDFLFGPLEGGGVLIPASDKGFDCLYQHFDAGKAGSLQCAAAQNAKPAFNLIEPGAVCRDEMKCTPLMLPSAMTIQPNLARSSVMKMRRRRSSRSETGTCATNLVSELLEVLDDRERKIIFDAIRVGGRQTGNSRRNWKEIRSDQRAGGIEGGASTRPRRQDYQRADAIKRANPASWKHLNLYGACSFLDIGDGVDLQELVNLLEAARGRGAAAPD